MRDRPEQASTGRIRLPDRRTLVQEVWLVLGLSALFWALSSILLTIEIPAGEQVGTFADTSLARQLLDIAKDLVPVLLVLHLLHRSGERASDIGLDLRQPGRDLTRGTALAALVGLTGLLLYLVANAFGLNRDVVPAPPGAPWWAILVIVLGAARSALEEEVIIVGYLLRRLDQLGWAPWVALGASALIRATFHLYQGWGGFVGNLAMGLLFGRIYQLRRRTMPLVVAHFLINVTAGIGYLMLRGKVSWLPSV